MRTLCLPATLLFTMFAACGTNNIGGGQDPLKDSGTDTDGSNLADGTLTDSTLDDGTVPDSGSGCPTSCDDGVLCTVDTCVNGSCINSPNNSVCSDGIGCTVDTCNATTGCSNTPNDSFCNDPQSCIINEMCDPQSSSNATGCTVEDSCTSINASCSCQNNTCKDAMGLACMF